MTTSVIIPTLNEEKLLDQMLQQFTPALIARYGLEIIISDGGSSDRTLEIARKYSHCIVENPPGVRQTISMGRNEGAAVATGNVLVFLNADTLLQNADAFFSTIQQKMADPTVVAMTCSVRVFPAEERAADRAIHGFYNWFFATMNKVGMGMGRGECHIIRRDVFQRLGGYAVRIAAGEDYDMFRRLERLGRIRFLNDIVVFESPRRYRKFGYTYVTVSWFLNFLTVFFLRRSISDQWKQVR